MRNRILDRFSSRTGQIALLIDPEKTNKAAQLAPLIEKAAIARVDYLFVGGSSATRTDIEQTVHYLKKNSDIPVVLFPGSSNQLSKDADALLFLNLISGRNPDFLIGHHVSCAEEVLEMNLEVIPTSYILVDGGKMTSVAYYSQTTPIPHDNPSIALKTAIAGHLMGQKITYFDAGSGAQRSVPLNFITSLHKKIQAPIIVGGGITSIEQIEAFTKAQANVIVIGNKIEANIDFLLDIASFQNSHKTKNTL